MSLLLLFNQGAGGGSLVGTSSATSGAVGVLSGTGKLVGSSLATSGAVGLLSGSGQLVGTSSATSSATGIISNLSPGALSGVSSAVSGATGVLTALQSFAPNGGARREYQPYHYELQNRREIEKKFKEVELDLRAATIKIEALELKRTRDLADEAMQAELLMLIAEQNRLMQLIETLRQQKLRVLRDDEEFLTLLMYLN